MEIKSHIPITAAKTYPDMPIIDIPKTLGPILVFNIREEPIISAPAIKANIILFAILFKS